MRSGSDSSEYGAGFYKKDVMAVSPRQIAISSSKDVFFSFQNVPKRTGPSVGMMHDQKT